MSDLENRFQKIKSLKFKKIQFYSRDLFSLSFNKDDPYFQTKLNKIANITAQ